jgi:hypothetical protein
VIAGQENAEQQQRWVLDGYIRSTPQVFILTYQRWILTEMKKIVLLDAYR